MKFIKKQIKKILKFLGFTLKKYSDFDLEQLNFNSLNFTANKKLVLMKYKTKEGKEFILYKNYRYGLKRSYLSYPSIRNLLYLSNNIKSNKKIKSKLKEFIGTHTLTYPIKEIDNYANEIITKYSDFFIESNNSFFPKINEHEFFINLKKQLKWTKSYLKMYNLNKKKMKILEVGPGSGMLSISLSLLGHEVIGIDKNYYKEDSYPQIRRKIYQKLSGSKVSFIDDDILTFNKFNKNYFDLVLSISVLEHIKDFPLLLDRLKKILDKNGFLLHRYGHYWSEEGAHSLGNLDAPWLHAILKINEIERYLKIVRPYEYKVCLEWIKKCLNKKINSSYVQKELVKRKFSILSWHESKNFKNRLNYLDPKIINQVLNNNPQLSLSDLLCSDTTFLSSNLK